MKVKVLKRYVDKYTKEMMEVGDTTEYQQERADDLIKRGYVTADTRKNKTAEKESEEK